MKINVRIIAATNRDLAEAVNNAKFRADLLFRLNVFPIKLPPLRERSGDIPLLVNYFLDKISKKLGKPVPSVDPATTKALENYNWKGNIRGLEHIIEEALIISPENILRLNRSLHSDSLHQLFPEQDTFTLKTLRENETQHILALLNYTQGKVRGAGGAAELLDVKPSTLESRMKKFGIQKTFSNSKKFAN